MKTTATNRKIHQLLTGVRSGVLKISPAFQRRLVWKTKDKCNFLQTVLDEYPFPEIYIAIGGVDLDTGEGIEMLVDGQQRVNTLCQYFDGSDDLKLGNDLEPYADLPEDAKKRFLQYDVVVRDLGSLSDQEIRQVFQRINSTGYSLNAMEIHNSRFDGEFKVVAEKIAEDEFFASHRIFSANQVRRMEDTRFVLAYMITVMSTYFHRDGEIERYLEMYNEEFREADSIQAAIRRTSAFIDNCGFEPSSRVWKQADVFSLLVETHRALEKDGLSLDPRSVGAKLNRFYEKVGSLDLHAEEDKDVSIYQRAALQATNDRSNRIRRGDIVNRILRS